MGTVRPQDSCPQPHPGRSFRLPGASLLPWLACVLLALAACETKPADSHSLPVIPLVIAGQALETEVATSPEEQQRGLMYRDSLPENHAMLFVFEGPRQASFWMRHTRIPLSIAYLDASGKILEIHDMQPFDETSIRSRSLAVAFALEVNQGWFRKQGIGPGDRVSGLDKARKHP